MAHKERLDKLAPPLHFTSEVNSILTGEFPLSTEQCWLGRWNDAGKMKLFFLPFLCSYSQIFCSRVLLKFFKWTPELSQSCFYSQTAV